MALRIILPLIIILSSVALSQEPQGIFSMEDIEESGDISAGDLNEYSKFEKKIIESNITVIPPGPSTKKKISYKPTPFRAMLKKGSLIEQVRGDKQFKTNKDIFVKAIQQRFGDSYTYILDESGHFKYKTQTINLVSVEEDLKIGYEGIDPNETYQRSFRHNSQDTSLGLSHRLSFSYETVNANMFASLFDIQGAGKASATRFEWRGFYSWQIPVHFGLSLALENGSYFDGAVGWSTVQLGPLLKFQAFESKDFSFNINTGIQQSLRHNVSYSGESIGLSSQTWHIDFEAIFNTDWGRWSAGMEYRYQNNSVEEDPASLFQYESKEKNMQSFGFVVGREFNFTL